MNPSPALMSAAPPRPEGQKLTCTITNMPPEPGRARLRLAWLTPAAVLVALGPCRALPADLVFSGGLERVRPESISVRLANRILIEARLPSTPDLAARAIVAQYNIGDHVRITCRSIPRVWDEPAIRLQYLELTKLENLGPASPEELSRIIEYWPWRGSELLKRPAAAVPSAKARSATVTMPELEHARKVNLEFYANLPEFTADETAKRSTSRVSPPVWNPVDTLESEVTFKGTHSVRQHILRNGKPWDQLFQALPGFLWSNGFGPEVKPLFDPDCPTTIESEGRRQAGGKQLLAYRFSSPADACFGAFDVEYQKYVPARVGRIVVDDPGGHMVHYEEEGIDFPAGFLFAHRKEDVSWDYVKIGDITYLLPVAAEFDALYSSGVRWRVTLEYKNHRHL